MKQKLVYNQKLQQTLQLSLSMKKSLDILKMNQGDLLACLSTVANENPMITYTPSIDMHQFLMDTAINVTTLKDDLYFQLYTSRKHYCKPAAEFIIESLDENGFFTYDEEGLEKDLAFTSQQLQEALTLIKDFEPIGVASKNSIEAIAMQLHKQYLFDAEYIFLHEQDAIIRKDYTYIAKKMNIRLEEVKSYLEDMKTCNPFPCASYISKTENLLLPDFEIRIIEGSIEIIPNQIGHISIADEISVLKNNEHLKTYFDEAYYFIDSITKRNKTLLILANELIQMQKNYFLFHDELKPCTLLNIATKCGFHESTVSRTLSNKHYLFNNEIYPLKSLFNSSTKDGSSKDSILKAIQKLIAMEDEKHPYADFELVEQLKELDLYVSRRAIAKYRKQLHVPSSKERKKVSNI